MGLCFFAVSYEEISYVASVNPEFDITLARRLNQSRVSAMRKSSVTKIAFGTAEARYLSWALHEMTCINDNLKLLLGQEFLTYEALKFSPKYLKQATRWNKEIEFYRH